jgi:hypothetical protein
MATAGLAWLAVSTAGAVVAALAAPTEASRTPAVAAGTAAAVMTVRNRKMIPRAALM